MSDCRRSVWLRGLVRTVAISLCGLTISACAEERPQGELLLDIKLPNSARGQIAYLVFSSADGFPGDRNQAVLRGFVTATQQAGGVKRVDAGKLAPGKYAVSVYLDINGNRRLDRNWMGIPTEPVGASNDPKVRRRAPRFEECSFIHGSATDVIPITLVH